jgi:hypothetical protein
VKRFAIYCGFVWLGSDVLITLSHGPVEASVASAAFGLALVIYGAARGAQ